MNQEVVDNGLIIAASLVAIVSILPHLTKNHADLFPAKVAKNPVMSEVDILFFILSNKKRKKKNIQYLLSVSVSVRELTVVMF